MADQEFIQKLYDGLQAIADDQFPKKCPNCGRVFQNMEEFLEQSKLMQDNRGNAESGLREERDDRGRSTVRLFRNCACGSTMLEFFRERRDMSPAGIRRRTRFGELLELLKGQGIEHEVARTELLKFLRGEDSPLIRQCISEGQDTQ